MTGTPSPNSRRLRSPSARAVEIIVMLKGYDDTFAQDVYARNSYIASEIAWCRRCRRVYDVDKSGAAVVDLDALDATEPLDDE